MEANTEWGVDVQMDYSEYGRPRARLTAPELQRIIISNMPKTEFPKGFRLVIYNESGQIENTLNAKYGLADDLNKNMVAQNNVEVVNIKGDHLNTEELIWNQNTKQIYSNKFVKITTKKEIIMGDSLIADEKFSDYTIKKVTGTVTVEQK